MSKGDLGLIATALSIAYGLSKFVMGNASDRSNPRYFLAAGLFLSGAVNLFFGFLKGFSIGSFAVTTVTVMSLFWLLNGWFQGMGWPPCARTLTHWYCDRERGTAFGIWNVAHNVGAGLAPLIAGAALFLFPMYQSIFFVPALFALAFGVLTIVFLRDTPQSVGLPPIEEFKDDYPDTKVDDRERELTGKEIFLRFVLNNKFLWILALANVFAYTVRYGILNWSPMFLESIKGCTREACRYQFSFYEFAGIPGMILWGWVSDRFFNGRRGPVSSLCMASTIPFIVLYWLNPPGREILDTVALAFVGFLIYGPIMLIGVAAVDCVPKKAAGTAAGFTGLFGYLFGTAFAEKGFGEVIDRCGWSTCFAIIIGAAVLATLLLALTWNLHDRRRETHGRGEGDTDSPPGPKPEGPGTPARE
jgi:OPA family glycerol-3-phosphate transporter-like MFS transporter